MADPAKKKSQYEMFHRYWGGITVLGTGVTLSASFLTNASLNTLVWRAFISCFGLMFIGRVIIACWSQSVAPTNNPKV